MENQQVRSSNAKNVLLLGAGFTKNFGGLLANEMWAEIFNNKEVQDQPQIKKLMLKYFDFEFVYNEILSRPGPECEDMWGCGISPLMSTKEEKFAIINATKSAYNKIDLLLRNYYHPNSDMSKLSSVIEFINIFLKQKKKSFVFSLNQDLFFERLYARNICVPGVEGYKLLYDKEIQYLKLPTGEIKSKNLLLKENNFLIKLHGSCNWTSFDGTDTMVIGRGKKDRILKEPLLRCYFEIFENVLYEGSHNLIIIGYSFGDEHINSVLAKAVKKGLKLYILSPESPEGFKTNLLKGCGHYCDKKIIWEALAGYSQYVDEILKGKIEDPIKKSQFYDIFLGINYPEFRGLNKKEY